MLAPNPSPASMSAKAFSISASSPPPRPCASGTTPPASRPWSRPCAVVGATRVALEAIGPYAWPLTAALVAAGFEVGLADPRQVRAFRTAEGRIAKTDRLDAGLIARFARTMSERLRPAPEPDRIALKALSTRRRQLDLS